MLKGVKAYGNEISYIEYLKQVVPAGSSSLLSNLSAYIWRGGKTMKNHNIKLSQRRQKHKKQQRSANRYKTINKYHTINRRKTKLPRKTKKQNHRNKKFSKKRK